MNTEIATYTIGVIGFESTERRFLRRMLSLAQSCQPSFKPFDKSCGDCPHLVIVDAEKPGSLQSWHKFRRANAGRGSFSPVFVGGDPAQLPCPEPYVLRRPIQTKDLFTVLERAVTEVHGFRARPDDSSGTWRSPGINALVVDDSLPVRVQMRGALNPLASRVDFADSGARALELMAENRYSVVFLDDTLPDEDTYDLSGRIKKHPLQSQAVVVMLTSSSSPADRVMGLLAGVDNYLMKPIQREMFNDLVEIVRPAAAI
jgi:CheY-like chemotaxis protein